MALSKDNYCQACSGAMHSCAGGMGASGNAGNAGRFLDCQLQRLVFWASDQHHDRESKVEFNVVAQSRELDTHSKSHGELRP